jgi:hypothetical protein
MQIIITSITGPVIKTTGHFSMVGCAGCSRLLQPDHAAALQRMIKQRVTGVHAYLE